jgi:hypothetical protein
MRKNFLIIIFWGGILIGSLIFSFILTDTELKAQHGSDNIKPIKTTKITTQQPTPQLNKDSVTSSKVCGKCHRTIYNTWKESMHAKSLEDPIFNGSYAEVYKNTAGAAKYNCLKCHAPVVLLNNDYDLRQEITKEGVTCDFCHSVKGIDLSNKENPFQIQLGLTKWGPLKEARSPVHETQFAFLFNTSSFCAGCHEYDNEHGLAILSTYSEWTESTYASEGKQCHYCHIPQRKGVVVFEDSMVIKGKKQEPLLCCVGVNTLGMLKEAIRVNIKDILRKPQEMKIIVEIENYGAGHRIPTGMPNRKLALLVEVKTANNQVFSNSRVYEKIVIDKDRNILSEESDILIKGSQIIKDNRIAPKEIRQEVFVFPIPLEERVTTSANVFYLYEPCVFKKEEIKVELASDEWNILESRID